MTGIPVPERSQGRFISKWTFLTQLKVGDSFVVESAGERTIGVATGKRLGMTVTSRKLERGGYRIWRVK